MTKRDEQNKQRGWSLVFDEHTDKSVEEERPEADSHMTVIDRDLSVEVNAALNALSREKLLANVAVPDDVIGPGPDDAPEMTIRAPAPSFDAPAVAVTDTKTTDESEQAFPDLDTDDDLPQTSPSVKALEETPFSEQTPFLDETPYPDDTPVPDLEHDATVRPGDDAPPTLNERPNDNVERTMKAPIPYDLFHEGALPEVSKKPPTITRRRVSAAERAPSPPRPPRRSGSETMLDLAAQLGMAPTPPSKPEPDPEPSEPFSEPRIVKATMEIPPAPNDEIDLLPFLDGASADSGKSAKKPVPVVKQKARPAEGPDANEIHRLVAHTDAAARAIPVALAAFVIIGTVTALAMLFTSKERRQVHVEMRFVSLAGPLTSPMHASKTPTRINIDTVPEGVFILLGQDILGKTPIAVDLPYRLDERVAVELKSPYFERWVGEVARDPTGEYRVFVELKRKQE